MTGPSHLRCEPVEPPAKLDATAALAMLLGRSIRPNVFNMLPPAKIALLQLRIVLTLFVVFYLMLTNLCYLFCFLKRMYFIELIVIFSFLKN